VLGRTNPLSIVSAFFKILEAQRTVEERALEEKKSVLEYRHLDAPPRIVLQYQPTSEVRLLSLFAHLFLILSFKMHALVCLDGSCVCRRASNIRADMLGRRR
jgi:hypothetical protein